MLWQLITGSAASGLLVERNAIKTERRTHAVDDAWVKGAHSSPLIEFRILIEQFIHKVGCLKFKASGFVYTCVHYVGRQ